MLKIDNFDKIVLLYKNIWESPFDEGGRLCRSIKDRKMIEKFIPK